MRMRMRTTLLAAPRPGRHQRPQEPYRGEVSVTDALAALPEEVPAPLQAPVFTPSWPDPLRQTGQIPELAEPREPDPAIARPYVSDGCPLDNRVPVETAEAKTFIGNAVAITASAGTPQATPALAIPMPDSQPPHVPSPWLPDSVLCSSPGWAGKLMAARVRNGEWENVYLIAERGWAQDAADEAAQHVRARLRMTGYAGQLCAALGWQPEAAGMLRRRVSEMQAGDAVPGSAR